MSDSPLVAPVPTAPTTEAAPTQAAAPTPQAPDPRIEQLKKKEAALVKERESMKRERANFQTKMQQMESINKQIQEFEALKKTNSLDALKKLGFNETDLFNALAGAPEPTPEQKMEKIADSRLEAYKKQEAERMAGLQMEQDKKTINNYKQSIAAAAAKDTTKYEFINFYGQAAAEQVFELIETHFKNEGELIPLSEALESVEEFYEQTAKEMSEKVNKLKPKQAKEDAAPPAPQVNPVKPAFRSPPGAPTAESREAKKQRLIALIKQNGLKR